MRAETTVFEYTYGWDLTCARCGGVIPEGSGALVTEDGDQEFVRAEHADCTEAVA